MDTVRALIDDVLHSDGVKLDSDLFIKGHYPSLITLFDKLKDVNVIMGINDCNIENNTMILHIEADNCDLIKEAIETTPNISLKDNKIVCMK